MNDKDFTSNRGLFFFLRRIPITIKTVLLTVTVGCSAWIGLDYLESESIRKSLNTHFMAMLKKDAKESQSVFFSYINMHTGVIKIIISHPAINDYIGEISKSQWFENDNRQIIYHADIPIWLPNPSILRHFFYINYALLVDDEGNVREVYHGRRNKNLPESILRPTQRLIDLSRGQGHMALFGDTPYLIRSEYIVKSKGEKRASLMLVSPVDHNFFKASQEQIAHKVLSALVESGTGKIVSSSDPELLPPGAALDTYKERFLITGKSFFDYGASELQMKFVTFIPNEEYKKLSGSILSKERSNRALGDVVLIFSFIIVMVLVTRNVKKLNNRVMSFSRKLGIAREDVVRGDEIVMLDKQFQYMFKEIESTTMELKRYSGHLEELVRERTSEIMEANEKVTASLQEKELLLSEIHHRVKNNLQIISSLLRLQSRFIKDRDIDIKTILDDCRSRIRSMALIHEKLYMANDFANIDLNDYIKSVSDELLRSYNVATDKITLNMEVEKIYFTIDTAIPLGLILNELITNSIKYAFPKDKNGIITIQLHRAGNERFRLRYRDNGIGIPDDVELEKPKTLGIHLIKTFLKQLNGEWTLRSNDGMEVIADFKGVKTNESHCEA